VKYPKVAGEFETIALLKQGSSLARFGDGELKIMHGAGYVREPVNPELTAELRRVFLTPDPRCLIGIPTLNRRGPKYANWTRHAARFNSLVVPGQKYVSAFVSRPDSSPWINVRAYALRVQAIWEGKRVVVVCEKSGSMISTVRKAAGRAFHLSCPRHRAYSRIDVLEADIIEMAPDVAILCAGPTASCLANRLAARGIQAVDFGSAGQFLGRLLS